MIEWHLIYINSSQYCSWLPNGGTEKLTSNDCSRFVSSYWMHCVILEIAISTIWLMRSNYGETDVFWWAHASVSSRVNKTSVVLKFGDDKWGNENNDDHQRSIRLHILLATCSDARAIHKKTTNKQKQTIPTPIAKKQHLGVHVDRPLMKYAPFKGIGTAYPSQDFSAEMAKKSDMNLFSR